MLPRSIPDPTPGQPFRELNAEPFCIEPKFFPRIWGARSLAPLYPLQTSLAEPIGEAWLTSVDCKVATGKFAGKTLGEAWHEMPASWRGAQFAEAGDFPLLLKFIFTKDKLSIQVHPGDDYASMHEKAAGGRGKTEMWHVVSAEPGAKLLAGLKPGVSRIDFVAAMKNGTLESLFKSHDVRAGDTFFLPAGTPHTIGPGMIVCEVQQYSDLTYRIYDYERTDASGRPRELHLEKALDVIEFGGVRETRVTPKRWIQTRDAFERLVECRYFNVDRWKLKEKIHLAPVQGLQRDHFVLLVGLQGSGEVTWLYPQRHDTGHLQFKAGDCWFIPANVLGSHSVYPDGEVSLLWASVPDHGESK